MKITELEEGKEYIKESNGYLYKVVGSGLFYREDKDSEWISSAMLYTDAIKSNFTPYIPSVDWSKVEVDTPIYVWDDDINTKFPRHFVKYENGFI